jgi:hypothetical protein
MPKVISNYFLKCLFRNAFAITSFFRKMIHKEIDKLILQESYLYNFHLLSPFYCTIALERLQSVYCSPVEMKDDVKFLIECSVRFFSFFFYCYILNVGNQRYFHF